MTPERIDAVMSDVATAVELGEPSGSVLFRTCIDVLDVTGQGSP